MRHYIPTLLIIATLVSIVISAPAFAVEQTTTTQPTTDVTTLNTTDTTKQSATQTEQTRLAAIITKGSQEIDRRITALNKVTQLIDKSSKLSDANKTTLKSEVAKTIAGLTALKTKIAADTTLAEARTDAKAILADYRVYALMLPKINLVKVIDGQLAVEAKFAELAANFMNRFAELKTAGKDTSSLEATLANMNAKVASAHDITATLQTSVIALQPSDYNTDHKVLSGYRDQLKTARESLVSARADAKTLVNGIKELAS